MKEYLQQLLLWIAQIDGVGKIIDSYLQVPLYHNQRESANNKTKKQNEFLPGEK